MQRFPGNYNSTLFTLSGVAIGTLFLDDFTPNEQNSIGNWLILVGQVILTNAAQQVLIKGRQKGGYEDPNITGTNNFSGQVISNEEQITILENALKRIQDELENIKKG